MLGVFADDHHATLALDDLALFTNGLDRGTYLHFGFLLLGKMLSVLVLAAPRNAAAGQIIGRKLNSNFVAGIDADEVHAHFTRNLCHDLVSAGELHFKVRVRKRLFNSAFHFDDITLGQVRLPP